MEIGGRDLIVETNNPQKTMNEILNGLLWVDPLIEKDGKDGYFVYPDLESKSNWDQDFSTSPMIYFIQGSDYLGINSDELIVDKIKNLI